MQILNETPAKVKCGKYRHARNPHYFALTGKAAVRLVERGAPAARTSTIHRLIYKSIYDEERDIWIRTKKSRDELDGIDLIIVDEASIVKTKIAEDLISFGRPILSVGDAFQLPPPKDEDGNPYFMMGYDSLLREVHRQQDQSPILLAATALRNGQSWTRYADGKALRLVEYLPIDEAAEADVMIAGRNTTRRSINRHFREHYIGVDASAPDVGDIVLCLKNDYSTNVFNGDTWQVDSAAQEESVTNLESTNTQYVGPLTTPRDGGEVALHRANEGAQEINCRE